MAKRIEYALGDRSSADRSRLTFIREVEPHIQPSGQKARRGLFTCDCGAQVVSRIIEWRRGHALSCGCLQREVARDNGKATSTHGMRYSSVYRCWQAMIQRTTPGSQVQRKKPRYIGVGRDPMWDTFEGFYTDMGAAYFEGAVLGRYGDVGDYTKDNVRWITRSQNGREMQENTRQMHLMSDGRYAADVAREHGVKVDTMQKRVAAGWSVDDAATRPVAR